MHQLVVLTQNDLSKFYNGENGFEQIETSKIEWHHFRTILPKDVDKAELVVYVHTQKKEYRILKDKHFEAQMVTREQLQERIDSMVSSILYDKKELAELSK